MKPDASLFSEHAAGVAWPVWFRPSKSKPTQARNVARGLHPLGLLLLGKDGPADARCGNCALSVTKRWSGTYFKCSLLDTKCRATDICRKYPACLMWKREERA